MLTFEAFDSMTRTPPSHTEEEGELTLISGKFSPTISKSSELSIQLFNATVTL